MNNSDKIILDLCGGTGSWSKSYEDAGYLVLVITLPDFDIRKTTFGSDGYIEFRNQRDEIDLSVKKDEVYGILAAPPCTMFSFTRTKAVKPRDLKEAMECVRACLDIIWRVQEVSQDTRFKKCPLEFWALENPYHGFLKKFLGKPAFLFDPWEFGDGYQKKTAIWGYFNEPEKNPKFMTKDIKKSIKGNRVLNTKKFDRLLTHEIHPDQYGKLTRQERRSITPKGFAKAFFKANQ